MSCPQTQAEFENYFFNLINRTKNAPADDWAAVMSKEYNWNGTMMVIPPGVGPGVILPPDAPFYGLTQQWSGGPKARLFLPAAIPDGLGYYTCQIQYIRRVNPSGVSPEHVWDFDQTDGNPYVPICSEDGGNGGNGGGTNPDHEARITELEVKYTQLEERVSKLENASSFPKKVAFRNLANGKIVAAEINQTGWLRANRDGVGPWEEFELIILE